MKRLFAVLVLLLTLSACGQPLDLNVQPTVAGTRVVPQEQYEQSSLDTVPSPEGAVATAGVPIIPTSDGRPDTQLPADAKATFDQNKVETLDVGGRYYTLGECVAYSCSITLWPDNTQVWVRREVAGLEKFVPTPITVRIVYTPTPAPRPFTCGPNGEVTIYGYGNLEQRCMEEYLAQYGGNRGELNSPSPQPMP